MKDILKRIFIENWPRKLFSLIIAIIIWFVLSESMVTTKTISSIPIRVINLPDGKTVEGVHTNGALTTRVTLTFTGSKQLLEDLSANDLEIVLDATDRHADWVAVITPKNLVPTSPAINLSRGISKISHKNFIVKIANLVSEQIPVVITQPIGQPPKGYHFLDVWPYQLYLTVSGPEEAVKKLKTRGLKLTFNLSDVSREQLDHLHSGKSGISSDVVSFYVPEQWKQLTMPSISSTPLKIDDPSSKHLRIDFVRYELVPINNPLPISLYFPLNQSGLSPSKVALGPSALLESKNGQKVLPGPLYAKGVGELFVDIVRNMMEVVIVVQPKGEKETLDWSLQFINPNVLEDRYVSLLLSDRSDTSIHEMPPNLQEDYLRNRFRNFMSRIQLFKPNYERLDLKAYLDTNRVIVSEIAPKLEADVFASKEVNNQQLIKTESDQDG